MVLGRSLVKEGKRFEGWKEEKMEEEGRRATGREQYRDRSSGRPKKVIL
jgi:hypothetical protein